MSHAKIVRIQSGTAGIFGVLIYDSRPLCCTLELSWRDNKRNISCIPTGHYTLSPYKSSKFGKCFVIHPVYGRSGILIHTANSINDLKGCVGVAQRFDYPKILDSRKAMKVLRGKIKKECSLEITQIW